MSYNMVAFRLLEDYIGRDSNDSDSGEETYTRVFTAESDNPLDGPDVFKKDNRFPKVGDIYISAAGKGDIRIWATNVRYSSTLSRRVWKVIVSYSNRLVNPSEALVSPELRKPRFEWDTITQAFPVTTDINGIPIANKADDLFDPPLTTEDSWQILRVTRNQVTFDEDFYLPYQGKINSNVWNRKKKHQVKCRKIKATDFFESGKYWWKVTLEFEIKQSRIPNNNILISTGEGVEGDTDNLSYAWVSWILNRGFREYREVTPGIVSKPNMKDPNSKFPVVSPYPLDENGRQLGIGEDLLYLGYETLFDIDFGPLDVRIPADHSPG